MANVLDTIISDKQDIKNQLGDLPSVTPAAKLFNDTIRPVQITTKVTSKQIAGAMIWGSQNFGVWGTDDWGDESGSSFILGSQNFGILGSTSLGAGGSSEALYAVVPVSNIHTEYFGQDMFIDTATSTGTLDTTAETYTMTAAEILQSEIIAKPRGEIYNAKLLTALPTLGAQDGMTLDNLELGITEFEEDVVGVYVSNDAGSTWNKLGFDETHTFSTTTSDDELKFKVVCVTDYTIDQPVSFAINL